VGFTLEEDFDAYFYCHSNKRNAINTLAFELDYERPLFNYEMCWIMEAINGTSILTLLYTNLYKMNFFAVDFRYRVVHHLIISKLNRLFQIEFILDSYACGVGKGTHGSFITP